MDRRLVPTPRAALDRGTALTGAAPRVSVCVATRDRADRIARLVEALHRQTIALDRFELVVVDDGSRDATSEVLARLGAQSEIAIRALGLEHSLGPAAGRNRAWRAARGDVIAFTDDDCVPTPDWLERGLAACAPGCVAVGRVERDPAQRDPVARWNRELRVTRAQLRWYATANLFLHRADLERLGGFDERYRSAAGEDTDLGLRAEALGLRPVFAARAVVHHDVMPTTVWGKVRDQRRWADLALLVRENPSSRLDLLHRRLFWRRDHARLLLFAAGAVLVRRPWAWALAVPWVHAKLCEEQLERDGVEALLALPGLLMIDAAEIAAALEGSVRYRTLVI